MTSMTSIGKVEVQQTMASDDQRVLSYYIATRNTYLICYIFFDFIPV